MPVPNSARLAQDPACPTVLPPGSALASNGHRWAAARGASLQRINPGAATQTSPCLCWGGNGGMRVTSGYKS